MANASAGGLSIAYDDRGSGDRALLFLPGWCAGRAVFDAVTERLSARHRTLALDWRGHGESSSSEKDCGTRELVDDAVLVIEASRAKEVVPIATAHAGFVAIQLRRRLGARVSRIVLVDWIVTEPPPAFLGALSAMSNEASALTELRQQLLAYCGRDTEALAALLRAVGPRDADGAIFAVDRDAQEPRVAAHLAVLHEGARDLQLDVDLDVLPAVRARDDEILLDAGFAHPWKSF